MCSTDLCIINKSSTSFETSGLAGQCRTGRGVLCFVWWSVEVVPFTCSCSVTAPLEKQITLCVCACVYVSALNPDNGGSSCDKRPCDAGVSLNCSLARGPHFLNVAVPPEIAQPWDWLFFACVCLPVCAYVCQGLRLWACSIVQVKIGHCLIFGSEQLTGYK